jgi:hypothetical protein
MRASILPAACAPLGAAPLRGAAASSGNGDSWSPLDGTVLRPLRLPLLHQGGRCSAPLLRRPKHGAAGALLPPLGSATHGTTPPALQQQLYNPRMKFFRCRAEGRLEKRAREGEQTGIDQSKGL